MVEQPIHNFLVIQPSRSFFNKADDAAKAKAEQAANAEQSEQNVRFPFQTVNRFRNCLYIALISWQAD